jgi:arylsulfatase A-like enzyme
MVGGIIPLRWAQSPRYGGRLRPESAKPGWNLITAMADDAIAYMNRINSLAPEQPFFVYYVPGATHATHHATPWSTPSTRPMKTRHQDTTPNISK